MRIALVALVFIASQYIHLDPVSAKEPVSKNDSIALAQRKKAIADFNAGKFTIPAYHVKCNSFYAEEALYKMCGLKVEFEHDWNMCGTGMEQYYFEKNCYDRIIDSLMYATYGNDIYERVSAEGGSLELHEPKRYPSDDDPFAMQRASADSNRDSIL